ncbi:MAG TPA: dienelactone hydrolase family protein [Burkholderiales bacterium]|nr:dienelactone hydrolase family protein [Burkholderiales bacterium]
MLKFATGALLAFFAAAHSFAAIKEEPVAYKDGDTTLNGFIVYDDAVKGKRPGIVVVHEWWGITPHVRSEARKFAEQGYTAIVADMYGGKTADNPTDASGLMKSLMGNPAGMQSRFHAAYAALAKHATVDAKRIGASGYCMGGAVALNMARAGADLAGVVAFHASLGTSTPAAPGKVKGKVLVLNGADDPFVKPDSIEAFKKEMDAAKVDYKFVNYPGAVHAYTNPDATEKGKKYNLPLAYNAEVDKQAKSEAAKFFAQTLKK